MFFDLLPSEVQAAALLPTAGGVAALEPPAGMTGWFKLDDATPGESDAFPAVANAGSVVEDWSRVATGVTLQTASGPNGMKFAQVAASSDEVVAGAQDVDDGLLVLAHAVRFHVDDGYSLLHLGSLGRRFSSPRTLAKGRAGGIIPRLDSRLGGGWRLPAPGAVDVRRVSS